MTPVIPSLPIVFLPWLEWKCRVGLELGVLNAGLRKKMYVLISPHDQASWGFQVLIGESVIGDKKRELEEICPLPPVHDGTFISINRSNSWIWLLLLPI